MYFWRYVGVLALLMIFVAPIARSHAQQFAVDQDVHGIRLDYGLLGREGFRKRLDEILLRHGLDLDRVSIEVKENRRESMVDIAIRYPSAMSFFLPWTRDVVIDKQILLRPVD